MRLFYAADIHGSERVWRKFLGAAKFYAADALILGGDLTGKVLVPIIEDKPGRYVAELFGGLERAKGDKGLAELEEVIRFNGHYPYCCSREAFEELVADKPHRDAVMEEAMMTEMARWVRVAEQRLAGTTIRIYAMPGNDDSFAIDSLLNGEHIENVEGSVVRVGPYQLLSSAWSNPTPWHTPRETDEEGLHVMLEGLAEQLAPDVPTIFNLHVPPFDSGLDTGPEAAGVDAEGQVIVRVVGGVPQQAPVGSKAIRELVERHQPLVSFHSHIHESRNAAYLGRSLCLNPGSSYQDGDLDGVVVDLDGDRVLNYQFVKG